MITLDTGERASGKTTRAVEWAANNPRRVVVTPHHASLSYIQDIAKKRGVTVEVISWQQYVSGTLRGRRDLEVYIDEVGMCLGSLGGTVVGMSGL